MFLNRVNFLRDGLDELGMTPGEFAAWLNHTDRQVRRWLRGETEPPLWSLYVIEMMRLPHGQDIMVMPAGDSAGHSSCPVPGSIPIVAGTDGCAAGRGNSGAGFPC